MKNILLRERRRRRETRRERRRERRGRLQVWTGCPALLLTGQAEGSQTRKETLQLIPVRPDTSDILMFWKDLKGDSPYNSCADGGD